MVYNAFESKMFQLASTNSDESSDSYKSMEFEKSKELERSAQIEHLSDHQWIFLNDIRRNRNQNIST